MVRTFILSPWLCVGFLPCMTARVLCSPDAIITFFLALGLSFARVYSTSTALWWRQWREWSFCVIYGGVSPILGAFALWTGCDQASHFAVEGCVTQRSCVVFPRTQGSLLMGSIYRPGAVTASIPELRHCNLKPSWHPIHHVDDVGAQADRRTEMRRGLGKEWAVSLCFI